MGNFVILLGGDIELTARLRHQVAGARFIAADSGMRHAAALGIRPELWVGDFDSAGSELLLDYADVPRQKHPAAKDATDGELAINEALARGATALVLLGGLGGQADHVTAHLGLLLKLAGLKIPVFTTSGEEEAHPLVAGEMRLDAQEHDRVSIVPWSDLSGLTISGVEWPLQGRDVAVGSTLTVSNMAEGQVIIALEAGTGIVFHYPLGTM
jgi:thiamine pyrophosphokinase